jgi:hypothetical protein
VTSAKPHGKGHRHGDHKRDGAGKDGHKGHAHGGEEKAPKHHGKD